MSNQATKTISDSSVTDIITAFELTGHSVYYHLHDFEDKEFGTTGILEEETYTFVNNDTDSIVMSIDHLIGSPIAHLTELNITNDAGLAIQDRILRLHISPV